MKYAVDMGTGAMICLLSALNFGSGVQTLMGVCVCVRRMIGPDSERAPARLSPSRAASNLCSR
jgi:hypothetical protein